jgi:hypothetical protein
MKLTNSIHILFVILALLFPTLITANTESEVATATVLSVFTTVVLPATVVRIPDPTTCPVGQSTKSVDSKSRQVQCSSEASTIYIPIPFLVVGFVGCVLFFVLRAIL